MLRRAVTLIALLMVSGFADSARAACQPDRQQINDNNSLILLGGTAKGALRQFAMGEFGKNVDYQRRLLGQFDRCGTLTRADLSYYKHEAGVSVNMGQRILQVKSGWQEMYELSVVVERDGKPMEVNHKQGTVSYRRDKTGKIVSATDRFLLSGKPGLTQISYRYDRHQRLSKRVAEGSDDNVNGTINYAWNRRNQPLAISSDSSKMTFSYDKQGREQRQTLVSISDVSSSSTTDNCQLWDDNGNCTLSYSHETEVFAQGKIRRNITSAYRFEYWPPEKKPARPPVPGH
ncbi:hypothetical protein BL250_04990 [Erwinia sp. OLTSP20]|uniref:hypothetical protein n=1 Tax=unclassified Erwinia TaxID=2622719 RepID=UPI000C1841E6|nr:MULTISPECIES: hypothetical protein [unclassified Erwinia]PIJ50925.1 hypothetical protein BV501_06320 [Erwinia sp. OAMSP11]PIJ75947.1 hypothetical protein BK416_00190 [Erwinia sp. OLSSP12]PIJ83607.1 hypothetical protein BLD47_04145 [Erwinia sp. OLCASP19]PIJ87462.1 hypothetical protein BLD46_00515 [Erwinia sp. OLMTSP26]PIJ89011.1 hypothetical protein BLD49_00515 [Erwinia sp. OLMDSP33]